MKLYGKVLDTIPKERIVIIEANRRHIYLYFQRRDFKEFGPYFFDRPYLFVEVSEEKRIVGSYSCYEVTSFQRIVQPSYYNKVTKRTIFFDSDTIKRGVKELLNKPHNKMFIDLEFTMPAYYQTMPHVQEIIQYGIIIENERGEIIFEDSSLISPTKPYNLNGRTLKFLSRKRSEFDNSLPYSHFYNVLKTCMKKYSPKVYAWGKSDILAIEQSFLINKVKPINVRENHINLMQVMKNYYNLKDEMGLFQTYEQMSNIELEPQQHDAFEDAMLTREVFLMFKEKVNNDVK